MKSLLFALLLFAAPAWARADDVVGGWKKRLGQSSDHLAAGRYDQSLKITKRVLREMVDLLGPGNPATELLGIAITHKALALAGKGEKKEALWWWRTVLSMYPPFARSDLSAYGAAGAFLAENREPPARPDMPQHREKDDLSISAPRVAKRVTPDFPGGAMGFAVEGMLIVEVIIEADGSLTTPRVVQPLPAPTLTYTALDAVRRWQFEPAKRGGKPIPVIFNLSINYKLND